MSLLCPVPCYLQLLQVIDETFFLQDQTANFFPVVDGIVTKDQLLALIRNSAFVNTPTDFIIGTTVDEGRLDVLCSG